MLKKSVQRYAIRLRLDAQGLPSVANPFAASRLTQDFFNHGRSSASLRSRHWGILPGTKQKRVFFCFASFFKHLSV